MYDKIPKNAQIFELGTGNGGQMSRWRNCSKILGVEPDPAHIKEMWKRIISYDEKNKTNLHEKVNVLQVGGEETDIIIKEAIKWFDWKSKNKEILPFYIVSMLSLSFFWKDMKMLNGLISTLQQLSAAYRESGGSDVYFVFMTIEGHKIIDLFNNKNVK